MGFHASVIVMCDALSEIRGDEKFGEKLARAVLCSSRGTGSPEKDVKSGMFHCAATAVEAHHADMTSVVAFGNNRGQVLATVGGWDYDLSTQEGKAVILKKLADELGYSIRKKGKGK